MTGESLGPGKNRGDRAVQAVIACSRLRPFAASPSGEIQNGCEHTAHAQLEANPELILLLEPFLSLKREAFAACTLFIPPRSPSKASYGTREILKMPMHELQDAKKSWLWGCPDALQFMRKLKAPGPGQIGTLQYCQLKHTTVPSPSPTSHDRTATKGRAKSNLNLPRPSTITPTPTKGSRAPLSISTRPSPYIYGLGNFPGGQRSERDAQAPSPTLPHATRSSYITTLLRFTPHRWLTTELLRQSLSRSPSLSLNTRS